MTMLIDANGISMKYPGSSRLVLDNVNFSINEGASVSLAVVPNIGYDLSKLL